MISDNELNSFVSIRQIDMKLSQIGFKMLWGSRAKLMGDYCRCIAADIRWYINSGGP